MVGVVAQQVSTNWVLEGIVQEECGVRFEEDIGSAFFCRVFGHITQQRSFFKDGDTYLAVAVAAYFEAAAQRIDCLIPTPFSPTLFLKAFESYLPPVFSLLTASTSLPCGMPRP